MDELRENAQQIREAAAKAEETRKAIASGAAGINVGETRKAETATKTLDEIRASKEYVDAYARYIQSEDARELRALLSTNARPTARCRSRRLLIPSSRPRGKRTRS